MILLKKSYFIYLLFLEHLGQSLSDKNVSYINRLFGLYTIFTLKYQPYIMKQYTLFFTFIFFALATFGQEKKDLAVSLSAGYFNSPYYNNAHSREFYSFGFDYHISKRHILSANYVTGQHDYFENTLSNAPSSSVATLKGTNAKASYNTFSVLYKYKIINKAHFSIAPGAGAGILTHTLEYPYAQGSSFIFQETTWSDLVFPVTLDINYKVFRQLQIGLTGGFLIVPEYPILALHAGPKLFYVLK